VVKTLAKTFGSSVLTATDFAHWPGTASALADRRHLQSAARLVERSAPRYHRVMTDTTRIKPLHDWGAWALVVGLGAAAVLGIGLGFWAWSPSTNLSEVCDRVVNQLFTTDDPIELQRAAIIIHELDCSVRRRIPADYPQ
jgi:hypothetical protein